MGIVEFELQNTIWFLQDAATWPFELRCWMTDAVARIIFKM